MPRPNATRHGPDLLAEVFVAARRHGRASDPDHEVGDLQDALRIAWQMLTPAERKRLHDEYFQSHESWAGLTE